MTQDALWTEPLWTDAYKVGDRVQNLAGRTGVVVSIDPARDNAYVEDGRTITVDYDGHLTRHGSSHSLKTVEHAGPSGAPGVEEDRMPVGLLDAVSTEATP